MVFPLDEGLARRLLQAMFASPRVKMRRKNFAMGYVSTSFAQCDYLNSSNQYRKLTPASRALLDEFLSTAGPMVEAAVGHPFRIASTRQFQLVPNRPQADRHLDGWPVAMRKIFVLPEGCGKRSSTTWFRRRDGEEFTLESEKPIWVLFENSVVLHAPISGVALRPTIEFDIVPARQTSFKVVDAGLGGWYPHFPTEAELHAATRRPCNPFWRRCPAVRRGGLAEAHRPVARPSAAQGGMISRRACRDGSAARCRCRAGSPPPDPAPWRRSR